MCQESENKLFDLAEEYDQMLSRGLSVTGEDKAYFANGRVRALKERYIDTSELPQGRILDFGSGLGDTSKILSCHFPGAKVVGVDTSRNAIAYAERNNSSEDISFSHLNDLGSSSTFDLVYVNGVFHHIAPEARMDSLRLIRDALKSDGQVAFFENNPWSIPARIVMSRIPFDKDAQMISPRLASRLFTNAGFQVKKIRYFFFFPAFLSRFRGIGIAPLSCAAWCAIPVGGAQDWLSTSCNYISVAPPVTGVFQSGP